MTLSITRHEHERIVIGKAGDVLKGPIEIQVEQVTRGRVRLGVNAQKDVPIELADERGKRQCRKQESD